MPRQIFARALFVNCTDVIKQNLCSQFKLAGDRVSAIDRLDELDSCLEAAKFEYVWIDRETYASASHEDLLSLQKLSGLSDCVIIADAEISPDRFVADHHQLQEIEELISLFDHECRNVLQRIQMRIELIKTNSSDDEILLPNVHRIEQANESLRQLMSTATFLREPLELELKQQSLAALIRSSWQAILEDHSEEIETDFDLESERDFWVDSIQIKMAIGNIFRFLVSRIPGRGQVRVVDHPITFNEERFHRVAFQVFPSPAESHGNPQIQLAVCKKILLEHGGRLELSASPTDKTVCAIDLPLNAIESL